MKIQEAIEKIENRKHHHSGLDLFMKAMEELGRPQDDLRSIHVGGTNGKGSTVDYLRSVLNEGGYRVGTFTSPYLVSHHDRIRIDNQNISDEKLLYYIEKTQDLWEKYSLSMFEIDMMIASLYFKDEDVDFAIFEVGLGGRLDATNVLAHPLVSVITNIGLDHTQFLGETHAEIAYEKAGIIKDKVVCITGEKRQDCLDVFRQCCEKKHTQLRETLDLNKDVLMYKNRVFHLKSKARYQMKNASLAIEVIDYLNEIKGIEIRDEVLIRGIAKTQWLGRFEIVREEPLTILDGAHNVEGICALTDSMRDYENIHVLFSCLSDKNGSRMLDGLRKISQDITVCEFDFYRVQKVEGLTLPQDVKVSTDWKQAVDEGLKQKGVFLICGSLYFISEIRKYLSQN